MTDYSGPLLAAVNSGDAEEVARLVAAGADPNLQYRWGYPIFRACDLGHLDVIRRLVELGADVNPVSDARKGTPLSTAVCGSYDLTDEQNLAVVELLLDLGADPEIPSLGLNRQVQPLHSAILHKKFATACRLLDRGAKPSATDSFGNSAFDYAAQVDATDVIERLSKDAGPDFDSRMERAHKSKRLIEAAQSSELQTIERLLDEGVDINKVSIYGRDVLYHAAENDDRSLVQLLLDYGANPNNLNRSQTSLMVAANRGFHEIVELLLNAGADVSAELEVALGRHMTAANFAKEGAHHDLAKFIMAEMKRREKNAPRSV